MHRISYERKRKRPGKRQEQRTVQASEWVDAIASFGTDRQAYCTNPIAPDDYYEENQDTEEPPSSTESDDNELRDGASG